MLFLTWSMEPGQCSSSVCLCNTEGVKFNQAGIVSAHVILPGLVMDCLGYYSLDLRLE